MQIFVIMYFDLITMSIKAKLGTTYFTSYFRSQVKVICERTPTILLKMPLNLIIKRELLVTMIIISVRPILEVRWGQMWRSLRPALRPVT